jgi:two-component system invasion response regulator UvrY
MSDKKQTKLAIVDDHNLFRKGLIKLISLGDSEGKYAILFEAENGEDLKRKLDNQNLPDIVLMDIDMPEADGFEAVGWLRKYYPGVLVLVISMLQQDDAVLRMLRLGVKGYLSKDIEVEDMNMALEAISNKGLYYSDFVSEIMTSAMQGDLVDPGMPTGTEFSENERELMKYACTEMTYYEIASVMHVSPKTVDGYRDGLFKKLGVKSRVSLAMYAVRNGIVKL